MARPIGTPRTTRLRKLECECGNIAYQSRAQIKRGVNRCCCGGELIPADPDDAALVLSPERLAEHPAVARFVELRASAISGQAWRGGLQATGHRSWRSPDEIAAARLEAERREAAREARLGALRPVAPVSDPIPF